MKMFAFTNTSGEDVIINLSKVIMTIRHHIEQKVWYEVILESDTIVCMTYQDHDRLQRRLDTLTKE
jgi:hypothetical protein